ncbi:Predicted arabinose efflux permease, MFS family [Granulicella rosea]|uniref:Predicted arabinose efflux permease, MFS family n=1 Tax=Granulicella rosea TaxID=474952 RepID=A0A239K0N7_9BACT|nr:MFS transporter [Granulicella rosea]SNT11575.1 Predicted arabinose efflux permease, MFS family [Granulicella rosea]
MADGRSGIVDARHTLALACVAHALHDGYVDTIYVLLPIWQTEFSLDYAALAVVRAVYVGTLAAFQVPSTQLAKHLNPRTVLALGTLFSATGYAVAGLSGGLIGLVGALALAGFGGSTQHPLASGAVSRAYGEKSRGPLGTYNFAGDLGKASLPPVVSFLLTLMHWRSTLWFAAGLGLLVAVSIRLFMPPVPTPASDMEVVVVPIGQTKGKVGFALLFVIGILDTATRMGFLLFLPFLMKTKSASQTSVGIALSLVFIGGAFGKAACGWLGARLGLLATVLTTEIGTAVAILSFLVLPLIPGIIILPFLGVMLNGTSSVLYGTVPELVAPHRIERAFGIFYTGILGASALAPVIYGRLGDKTGIVWAVVATAITALAVVPLMLSLSPRLHAEER